jgi:hypothetical protein
MPAVADQRDGETVGLAAPDNGTGHDLRSLVEAYERRLIVSALSAAGGRQNRAAAILGMLPTTLCEKMKRLGISLRGYGELAPAGANTALLPTETADEFRWRGRLVPGCTLEIKGQRGDVHAEPATGDMVEVVARRSGRSAATQLAINVLEHDAGVVFSVFTTRPSGALASAPGPASNKLRADFGLRLPAGVRLEVRLLAGNIEAIGLAADVEASTLNGSVRVRGLSHPRSVS